MKQDVIQGYCFRCKTKRDMINLKEGETENDRILYVGRCVKCLGRVSRMGGMINKNKKNKNANR